MTRSRIWIEVMTGPSPETARPVLVSRDPRILEAVAEALRSRVAEGAEIARAARGSTALEQLLGDGDGEEEAGTDG